MNKYKYLLWLLMPSVVLAGFGCSSSSDVGAPVGAGTSSSSAASSSSSASTSSSSSSSSSSGAAANIMNRDLLQVVDLDDNGFLDVLWAPLETGTIYLYRRDGMSFSSYTKSLLVSATEEIYEFSIADVKGDGGGGDLLVSLLAGGVYWYEAKGSSIPTFMSSRLISETQATQFTTAYVGSDNRLDVVLLPLESQLLTLMTNSAGLPVEFNSTGLADDIGRVSVFKAVPSNSARAGDFVAASVADRAIYWYENDGQVSPGFTPLTIASDVEGVYLLEVSDINNDANPDVVWLSDGDSSINWAENNGLFNLEFTGTSIPTQLEGIYWLKVIDLDRDGHQDILVASSVTDTIVWFESDGANPPTFTEQTLVDTGPGIYAIQAVNLDGDAYIDLVLASDQENDVIWFENNGTDKPSFTRQQIEFNSKIFTM